MLSDLQREVLEQRLLANRHADENGCWIWTRSCRANGYGQTSLPNSGTRNVGVHRVAAALWLGFDLESELCVLHRCDIRRCFNPEHLFMGTPSDNTWDMVDKGRAAGGATPRYGQEIVERARALVASGLTRRETARRLGLSHTTVQAWCRDLAVERWAKPRRVETGLLAIGADLISSGVSVSETARRLNLTSADVSHLGRLHRSYAHASL